MRPAVAAVLLLGALGLAGLLRSLGFEWVFVDSETVVFAPGDAQYHVRRAFYGWANFPEVLFFDRYINFPGGAAISWPPLFDFVLSAFGRVLARDLHGFRVMAAWAPPVFGLLALLPVYALGRHLGGRSLGVGSAALLAALPLSVHYSRVGQVDHHCAVALIGACLLLVLVRLVDGSRVSLPLGVALAAGRLAILLTWHGSLLYLALVEGILWVAAAIGGRRDLYGLQSASALGTVAVLAPLVWIFPEPLAGSWSAIALSRLHVVAMSAVAVVSAGLWWLEGRDGSRSPGMRLAWTVVLGMCVLGALWVLPVTREGLDPALRFVTMRDGVGYRTGEQLPLFRIFGRETARPVWDLWGLFGYALPLLPFGVVWAGWKRQRRAALVIAAWCAWFGALALVQRRYGNDLGPAAAVGFAFVLAELTRRGSASLGLSRLPGFVAPVLLSLLLLSPPIVGEWWPRAARVLSSRGDAIDPALRTMAGSLTRFLVQLRELTPETAGFLDSSVEPEYGVVAHANFGHAIQQVSMRPTPVDPFWAFIGVDNWNAAFDLLAARSEGDAVALAQRLQARYVMTHSSARADTFEGWLHFRDGLRGELDGRIWPASQHFRLVGEGPKGGVHFARSMSVKRDAGRRGPPRVRGRLPYKLFEVVEGAVIEAAAAPDEELVATVRLSTSTGREIEWEARATAGPEGVVRLRVPYPTRGIDRPGATRALSPYRVSVGGRSQAVSVSDEEVRSGGVLRLH